MVSMYVYLRLHNSKTTRPNFTEIVMHVAHGRGSILLWRRCHVMYFRFWGWRHVFTNALWSGATFAFLGGDKTRHA